MGTPKNRIALNGKIYDVTTGSLMSKLPSFTKATKRRGTPKTITKNKTIDGFVAPQKTSAHHRSLKTEAIRHRAKTTRTHKHLARHKPQQTKTLMRALVRKPNAGEKARIHKAHGELRPSKSSAASISAKAANRLKRSEIIKKSKHVARFANAEARLTKKMIPLAVREPKTNQPAKASGALKAAASPSSAKVEGNLFSRALQQATGHEQTLDQKPSSKQSIISRKLRLKKRSSKIIFTVLVVSIVAGALVWFLLPDIQIRLASVRAGFSASLPAYQPAGFKRKSISYKSGEVTINYKSNSDERSFYLRQTASNWNSETLLEGFIKPTRKPYQTYQEQGKTVYIYDDANATWVSGGVWYKIAGNSSLSNDQLLKMADSL